MSLETIVIMSCVLTAITWFILFAFVVILLRYGTQGLTSMLGGAFAGGGMLGGLFGGDDDQKVPQRQSPVRATTQNVSSGSALRQRADNLDFPAPPAGNAQFNAQSDYGNLSAQNAPQIDNSRFGSTLQQKRIGGSDLGQQGNFNQPSGLTPNQPSLRSRQSGLDNNPPQQNAPNQPNMPSLSPSRPFSGDPMRPSQGGQPQPRYNDLQQRYNPPQSNQGNFQAPQQPLRNSPLPPRPQDNPPQQNLGNPNPPLQNRLQQQYNQQPPPNDNQFTEYRPNIRDGAGSGSENNTISNYHSGRDSRRGDDRDEIYDDGSGFFD